MNIRFISQKLAENLTAVDNAIIISITNSTELAKLDKNWGDRRLNLIFDDVDAPGSHTLMYKSGPIEIPYILFNEDMARMIINFVQSISGKGIKTIIVHCWAGISRSAAVAKFLAENLKAQFPDKYMLYNKLVYRILCETLQKIKEEKFKEELGK
jgi:predicted protein tyrosine phosphatase